MTTFQHIAYFVSPHGFGHAARSAAVMEALQALDPTLRFEIFTQAPHWFFDESLTAPFGYHALLTDIGLVQKDSLTEDLPQTVARLNQFLPFDGKHIQNIAHQVRKLGCQLIICDIAPMGIVVAYEAGIPAILVENFTWDWIYEGYTDYDAQLNKHIAYLQKIFKAADYHIQTEPICQPQTVDLTTLPVSRKVRAAPAKIRQKLGIADEVKMILLTMGGAVWDYTFLERLKNQGDLYLVVAGNNRPLQSQGNIINLPRASDIFYPDILNACDAVIGKAGYSTIAEVYHAGVPFGYIGRPRFRESLVLMNYIQAKISGLPFTGAQLQNGSWLSRAAELLALPRIRRNEVNGADQIADFICRLLAAPG